MCHFKNKCDSFDNNLPVMIFLTFHHCPVRHILSIEDYCPIRHLFHDFIGSLQSLQNEILKFNHSVLL